jgi:hypothetical protein
MQKGRKVQRVIDPERSKDRNRDEKTADPPRVAVAAARPGFS